ncbi:PREDICTED: probable membrane-associated kinase regulator 4 [Ipomoea nil]|uniref:probable membrane-associated kinase regulator 4 n=1 Tax=Ipomoea nil TaxID=35883 RepID=UPI0009011807|nr:PREDICTED: probable membrane-associated kinase regulator 4 [Ipomoea nil]
MHQIGWPEKSFSHNINAADDDEYIDIEVSYSEEEDFIIMDFGKHNPAEDKLRPMKKCVVISKRLQASMAYLRSLFRKSACKDLLSSAKAQEYSPETGKQAGNKGFHLKSMAVDEHKKVNKKGIEAKVISSDRSLSFSSAETKWRPPKRNCLPPSSNSSFPVSFSSSGDFDGHKFHSRSYSSFTSDIEAPIEAAIAHCRKSQKNME